VIYVRLFMILVLLANSCLGCVHNIPKTTEQYKQDLAAEEREKIFNVYNNSVPNSIILAYEKIYGNTFDIAKNYLQYNKETDNPTCDGFWAWLIKNLWHKDLFDKGDEFGIGKWLIDNRFNDKIYQEILKNYELLEKMRQYEK